MRQWYPSLVLLLSRDDVNFLDTINLYRLTGDTFNVLNGLVHD